MDKSPGTSEPPNEFLEELAQRDDVLRLIECPHCNSRFGLPPSSFAKTEDRDPQLHCSSCDKVFSFSENHFFQSKYEFVSSSDFQPIQATPAAKKVDEVEHTPLESHLDEEIASSTGTNIPDRALDHAAQDDQALRFFTARPTGEIDSSELFRTDSSESAEPLKERVLDGPKPETYESENAAVSIEKPEEKPLQENLFSLFQTKTIPQHAADKVRATQKKEPLFSMEAEVLKETLANISMEESQADDETPMTDEEQESSLCSMNVEVEADAPIFDPEPEQLDVTEVSVIAETDESEEEPDDDSEEESEDEWQPSQEDDEGLTVELPLDKDEAHMSGVGGLSKIIDISVSTSSSDSMDPSLADTAEKEFSEIELNQKILLDEMGQRDFRFSSSVSAVFLASPIIGFVLLLYGLSSYLAVDGERQQVVKAIASADLPSFPPAKLVLQGVSFERVTLLSGEEIFSVRGTLQNLSAQSYRGVEIEAALFDRNGMLVAKKAARVGRPVHPKGLPSEEVAFNLESQHAKLDALLSSQEAREVVIFFPSSAARDAEFYTARVRSVIP